MADLETIPIIVGDIGATKCRLGVANADGIVKHRSYPTPQDRDALFELVGDVTVELAGAHDAPLGAFGLPGPVTFENGSGSVQRRAGPFPNIAGMNMRFDLCEELTARRPDLKGMPLVPLNDGEAAALAAAQFYALDNNRLPLTYLGIGSGVGGDTCVEYETVSFSQRLLSEYGHTPIQLPDGEYTSFEKQVSGKSIQKLYGNDRRDAAALYADRETGPVWDKVGRDLARGIGVLLASIGMKQIIIGGGVGAGCNERFAPSMHEELDRIMDRFPEHLVDKPEIAFVTPELDTILGLRGCYFAAKQRLARE